MRTRPCVGAIDGRVVRRQALQDLRMRVMECVRETVGDRGEFRRYRVQEWISTGSVAAVVADLQHVGADQRAGLYEATLHGSFHIAGQQEASRV
jgi:hypothetical protein